MVALVFERQVTLGQLCFERSQQGEEHSEPDVAAVRTKAKCQVLYCLSEGCDGVGGTELLER